MRKIGIGLPDVEKAIQALADSTRLRILALLEGGEVCVCHIHESLGLPQSKVSRHLAYLRRAGLVEGRKQGLWVHYRLARRGEPIDTLTASVRHCLGHIERVQRDRRRLGAKTVCAPSPPGPMPAAECCDARVSRAPADTSPGIARADSPGDARTGV